MKAWMAWLVLALVFLIIEILSPTIFFFACLGAGAIVAALSTFLVRSFWLPWVVFFISSTAFVVLSRPLAKKISRKQTRLAHIDSLVEQEAVVTEEIDPVNGGLVKVEGETWKAYSKVPLEKGLRVRIEKVEGTHLVVSKV